MSEDADDGSFTVSFSSGARYNIDDIRSGKEALMPDGEHAWVISAIYGLDNPDAEMDSMVLDESNFLGVSPIRCLICAELYTGTNRRHKCPQVLAERTPG